MIPNVEIADAGKMIETPVTTTLRTNFMPYAMSVIVSRAIPEIDGFKPSHRKLLYTMYLMGLLNGPRTKSANIVGQTMKLNPHGDGPIYDTMVRLSRGNETLLHPYIDSKGNFGKAYSRDMAYAASRYTEAKLAPISAELFADIKKNAVDMVDNYDGTMKEPVLFPVTFPSVLVNSNIGIAVGMASNVCSFNLAEVCETEVALLRNPDHDIMTTLKGPDFSGGGYLIYDEAAMKEIYETGRGSIRIRSRYSYDEKNHRIEVTEIPPTTTVEAIIDKMAELVKQGKLREISDIRDETDLSGLKLAIEVKRGTDINALMKKLFKITPLEDTFSANFTILVDGYPQTMGIRDILRAWTDFRRSCIKRRTQFDIDADEKKLHLLLGLKEILLDIDKAVKIVRDTKYEKEVVPNLMIGFGIDEEQAEYIAEIKLRHLNREYILSRLEEIEKLQSEIADLKDIISDKRKIDRVIISEQAAVARQYVQKRRTHILYDVDDSVEEEPEKEYPVTLFFTKEGYFKKITPQSLRLSSEQRLKEGDRVITSVETTTGAKLLFFTNMCQVYLAKCSDFEDTKASAMGTFAAVKLGMDDGEVATHMVATEDYKGNVLMFYSNGKIANVPLSSFATKSNRKKLTGAYCAKQQLVSVMYAHDPQEFAVFSDSGRMLLVNSALVPEKALRSTLGVSVMKLRKGAAVSDVKPVSEIKISSPDKFRAKNFPAAGGIIRLGDVEDAGGET
ncbi:MAG: DNA gyrase subunit A [Oscillospiraceae bacterium]